MKYTNIDPIDVKCVYKQLVFDAKDLPYEFGDLKLSLNLVENPSFNYLMNKLNIELHEISDKRFLNSFTNTYLNRSLGDLLKYIKRDLTSTLHIHLTRDSLTLRLEYSDSTKLIIEAVKYRKPAPRFGDYILTS